MLRSLFKRFKYFHVSWLCCIAIAGCSNPFTTANAPDQIRLGTFNLENFDGLNTEKLEAVSQIIERNFDVIGLQEVSPIAADKLKEKLNKSKPWEFILGETGGKQRIAMFYRKDAIAAQKVTEWRQVNITGTLRSPLVTYLKAGKDFDFTLVVVHQKGGGGKDADRLRQNQSDILRKEVDKYQKNTQSDPDLILVGDCGIGCVIDHIAISKVPKGAEEEYIPQSIQILDPQKDLGFDSDRTYFAKVSDHLPVRAIFRSK